MANPKSQALLPKSVLTLFVSFYGWSKLMAKDSVYRMCFKTHWIGRLGTCAVLNWLPWKVPYLSGIQSELKRQCAAIEIHGEPGAQAERRVQGLLSHHRYKTSDKCKEEGGLYPDSVKKGRVLHGGEGLAGSVVPGVWLRFLTSGQNGKRRRDGDTLLFLYTHLETQAAGYCHPHSRWLSQPQSNVSGTIVRDQPRGVHPI